MINLRKFFKSIFSDPEISTYRLVVFALDHLQRLIANNIGNKYDVIIAALTANIQNMHTERGELSYDTILQRASTMSLDNLRTNILKDLGIAESTIKVEFPNDNVVYLEFFPHGLTAWHEAKREELDDILGDFKTAITAHAADLKPAFVQKWNDYESNYSLSRNIQTTKKAIVSSDRESVKQQRRNLENQLMDNLYDLGKEYKRKLEKCNVFFNQSLLFLHHHITADKETFEGELMATDTIVITEEFENETLFRITNKGDFSFMLCFSDSETESCVSGLVIDKGETKEITAHDLNSDGKKYVKLTNTNEEEKCIYEVIKFL